MALQFTGERFVPELRGQIAYEHRHRYAIACESVRGKRALDIACGEGYGSALLARYAAEVIGVDIDAETIAHARRSYYVPNARFLNGSVTDVPVPDASIDVVVSFETIEHVADQERMLDEICRVLAPGGVAMISSPNKLVYSDLPQYRNAYHIRELYYQELRDLLRRRFRHVAIYGQRLAVSSVLHPLGAEIAESAGLYQEGVGGVRQGIPTLVEPMYFLAVCGNQLPLPSIVSTFLDPADDLFIHWHDELESLRRAVLTPAPAPPATGGRLELPDAAKEEHAVALAAYEMQAQRYEDAAQRQAQRAHELEQRDAQLEGEIAMARASLQDLRATIAGLEAQALDHEEAARVLAGHCAATEARVTALVESEARAVAAHAECDEEIDARNRTIAEQANVVIRYEAAIAERDEQLRKRDLELAQTRSLLEELVRTTEREHRILENILGSRSWRVTAPFRSAVSAIRKRS